VFQYIMRRLLLAVPMLLGAMSLVFFAMRVLPGDPCMAMMGDQATRDALNDCVRDLGLDRPLVVQYGEFLWKSVRLDFGQSFRHHYGLSEYIMRMFYTPW
jgi:ABC-type dipeptide/oligopeptide/nickel transport system permease component